MCFFTFCFAWFFMAFFGFHSFFVVFFWDLMVLFSVHGISLIFCLGFSSLSCCSYFFYRYIFFILYLVAPILTPWEIQWTPLCGIFIETKSPFAKGLKLTWRDLKEKTSGRELQRFFFTLVQLVQRSSVNNKATLSSFLIKEKVPMLNK